MIEIRQISTKDTELYVFMVELLMEAFPPSEYRAISELRHFTDHNPRFKANVVMVDNEPQGLLNYWNLGQFHFFEHLAVKQQRRNGGIGRKVMQWIQNNFERIIFEVEIPGSTDMAARRVRFYEGMGYKLCAKDYAQPAYNGVGDPVPMKLMSYGDIDPNTEYDKIVDIMKKEVYGIQEDNK